MDIIDAKISFRFDNLKINLIRINHNIITLDYPKHSHGKHFYEAHYIDGGEGTLICGKDEYPLRKGSLIMTGPLVTHEQLTNVSNPMSEYCFEFEITEDTRHAPSKEATLLKDTTFWAGNDTQDIYSKFQRLEIESERTDIGYIQVVKSIVTEILIDLIRNYNGCFEPQSYDKSTIDDKRTLITDEAFVFNYADITLDELCRRLGLSRRQTQRFLMKAYGKTFIELRTAKRLEKAEQLIKSGISRQDAAVEVGYENVKSLNKQK